MFYDPYASLFAGDKPAFRNRHGQPLEERYTCDALLQIAVEAASIVGKVESRETLVEAFAIHKEIAATFRNDLVQMNEGGHLEFHSPSGEDFSPDLNDYSDASIIQMMHRLTVMRSQEGPAVALDDLLAVFGGPLFYACLHHINDCILSLHMGGDAGDLGITATVDAMNCLHSMKSLMSGSPSHFQAMGKLGATRRHAGSRLLKQFAVDWFKKGAFPSAHKASIDLTPKVLEKAAEIGVRLSQDRVTKTIYTWLLDAKD